MENKRFLYVAGLIILIMIIFVSTIDLFFPPPDIDLSFLDEYKNITVDLSRGSNPDAINTIIVFSDFECPACSSMDNVLHAAKNEYDINLIFKHYPVHQGSVELAIASECARDQGMFDGYSQLLFDTKPQTADEQLTLASQLGLDVGTFERCLLQNQVGSEIAGPKLSIINRDILEATSIGIVGTPTLYVNDKRFDGSITYEKLANELT
jgi:protein-disulfide isomerase